MAIKSHLLQAHFARRRELEHERTERTAAVNRYYDHWGKVTTRFENWTKPEYYKNAEEQLKQKREKREKDQQQCERRERLRQLFDNEKATYQRELLARGKPKARTIPATNEQLQKIDQNIKERENIKRKLDLEAKLYGRWRHGVDDDNLLFDSRSENETLAKLNWLDKKIDEQLCREREEHAAQERNLRLQEEITKTEQAHKERELIREKEIREIRALQENHMSELKLRQEESDELKQKEKNLRTCLNDLEKEIELLEESCTLVLDPVNIAQAYNLKKIKVFIRKRLETFSNQIKLNISILERLAPYTTRPEDVKKMLAKYKEHVEVEVHTMGQIEAMYESEAKYNLQRLESVWQQQNLERYHEMKQLLTDEQCAFSARMAENLNRQTDIYELRSTHLSAIDNSNEKLKELVTEECRSPRNVLSESGNSTTGDFGNDYGAVGTNSELTNNSAVDMPSGSKTTTLCNSVKPQSDSISVNNNRLPSESRLGLIGENNNSGRFTPGFRGRTRSNLQPVRPSSSGTISKVTNSFTNLNLDVWQDMPSVRGGVDSPRMETQRSLRVVNPESAERPKYARKRVAWT